MIVDLVPIGLLDGLPRCCRGSRFGYRERVRLLKDVIGRAS